MKNIAIVPTIREKYFNQLEACFDLRFYKLFSKIFKTFNLQIITNEKKLKKYDLIVLTGGNELENSENKKKLNNGDKERKKISKKIIYKALKLNIPIFGICYGSQLIAQIYKSILAQKKHTKKHKVLINYQKQKKQITVNSYHNTVIKKLGKDLKVIAVAHDKTIEAFKHKNKKIICVMWHPERNEKIFNFDKLLIKNVCKN